MENNNRRKNDFSTMLKNWFDDDSLKNSLSLLDDINYNDIVKFSKKHINGMFEKLDEKDQKTVVDTVNNIQSLFDNAFGIKHKKYTVDDFKGCEVNVNSNGDVEKQEKKEEKKVCKNMIALDDLLGELNESTKKSEIKEAADKIVNYVVSTINDKENKRYTLYPATKNIAPRVEVIVPLEIIKSVNFNDNDTQMLLFELVHDSLIEKSNAHEIYIDIDNNSLNSLKITIPLKK